MSEEQRERLDLQMIVKNCTLNLSKIYTNKVDEKALGDQLNKLVHDLEYIISKTAAAYTPHAGKST